MHDSDVCHGTVDEKNAEDQEAVLDTPTPETRTSAMLLGSVHYDQGWPFGDFHLVTLSYTGDQVWILFSLLFLGDDKSLSVYVVIVTMIPNFWHGCFRNNQYDISRVKLRSWMSIPFFFSGHDMQCRKPTSHAKQMS